jgi:outer membrane protein assembly factor BamC
MSRQLFYFSVLSLTLSACSSVDSKRAQGNFDYANQQESKGFVIPNNLDKPAKQNKFLIPSEVNSQGSVGEKMDIRSPSLVLPIAASSRVITNSDEAIIWFDKTLENDDLLVFIYNAFANQLSSDGVNFELVKSSTQIETGNKNESKIEIYESDWFNNEIETGWLFTEIESSTSLRFRYEFYLKPHGRSVSLKVSLIDYMKTDIEGGSKTVSPIDKQRAEMAMLNEIVSQVDYSYRLVQQENRLIRANQQLVSIGENTETEPAYIVGMKPDNLWDNMPIFFEEHGFTITDLNETNKIYYVDFVKPEISLWDSIWGDTRPIIEVSDAKYQFVIASVDDENQKTSVTIYDANGEPLSSETLELIFPVMESGLSFRTLPLYQTPQATQKRQKPKNKKPQQKRQQP